LLIESHNRRWFTLAAGLVGLWLIALAVLSILTANPITLNRDQILESTDVVTAVVDDLPTGRVRIEKSWKVAVDDKQLTLSNLREVAPQLRQRLLIPVTQTGKGWQITSSKLPHGPPLVYPVTEESERQLRQLLKNRLP
jgi:hypothetical protein